jgi:hypothetical protein
MSSELDVYEPAAQRGLSLPEKLQYAHALAESELIPKAFRGNASNILIAIEYGQMLDIHPLTALNGIHVIAGKPTQSAELMRSCVNRAGHRFRILKHTSEEATIQITRGDDPDYPVEVTWTLDDARRAGLLDRWFEDWKQGQSSKYKAGEWYVPDDMPRRFTEWVTKLGVHRMKWREPWWSYPGAMLLARATSDAVRGICPEVLSGISYTPEELGAQVDSDGNVLEVAIVPGPPLPAVLQGLVDRYDRLPAELQSKVLDKLREDSHRPEVLLVDFREADRWWPAIDKLITRAEQVAAAEDQDPEPSGPGGGSAPDAPAAAGEPTVGEPEHTPLVVDGVDEAVPAGTPEPVPVGAAVEDRAAGDSTPQGASPTGTPAAEPRATGEHSNSSVAEHGGGSTGNGGSPPPAAQPTEVLPSTLVDVHDEQAPPSEPKADITARPAVFAMLTKIFPVPPEHSSGPAREEYSRTILLCLCEALGATGLTSRKEITPELYQRCRETLKRIEDQELSLVIDDDGKATLVYVASGEVAAA